jgi:hypothetical protein
MSILKEFLTFKVESAYDFAYDLPMKKNYSNPKMYTAHGDLKKRWYVYFSYRNLKDGKLKRMPPIYGTVNAHKTKESCLTILTAYQKSLLKFLKQGFNPFDDNTQLFYRPSEETVIPQKKAQLIEEVTKKNTSDLWAVNFHKIKRSL